MIRKWLTGAVLVLLLAGVIAAMVEGYSLLVGDDDADDAGSAGSTWDYYRTTPHGIEVFKTVRPCDDLVEARAEETDDRVEVTLQVDYGGTCGDAAEDKSLRVALDSPLGRRSVYDAACLAADRPEDDCLRKPGAPGRRTRLPR